MGFLAKLFGGGAASIDSLRKAVQQKRFAEARLLAEQLTEQGVEETWRDELAALQRTAGDGLARMNLTEAFGFQRAGDEIRAREHFELAREQALSTELRTEIEQLLSTVGEDQPLVPDQIQAASSGCNGCGSPPSGHQLPDHQDFPDLESQLELVLTSYPKDIAEHYRHKTNIFLQALLLSNAGDESAALPLWEQVPPEEQDALYHFEYGSALARAGNPGAARRELEKALRLAPGLLLACEALLPVLVSLGETAAAHRHLQNMLEQGQDPAFCHAQLAMLHLPLQQLEPALDHVREALAAGIADPGFLQLAARLFEQTGLLLEAEAALQRLPAGGCGGGISLPLAEFLLRQQRELGKVLDTFNAACRQDPDNPRWQLRVAQTYLARNWQKDGLRLLRKVVGDPRLEPGLQREAEQLLATHQA
jgi:tetratricopeptide (TPR) repeat protein